MLGKSSARVSVTIETITVAMAYQYLANSVNYRPTSKRIVTRYARDMKAGRWKVGGSTIDFNEHSQLVNGFHRLEACIEAGVPFQTIVARNVSADAVFVMDSGKGRRLTDALRHQGETSAGTLSTVVTTDWLWARDLLEQRVTSPTHAEGLEWFDRHPGLRDATIASERARHKIKTLSSVTGPFVYRTRLIDHQLSNAFTDGLIEGEDLISGSPILALRNYIIRQLASTGIRHGTRDPEGDPAVPDPHNPGGASAMDISRNMIVWLIVDDVCQFSADLPPTVHAVRCPKRGLHHKTLTLLISVLSPSIFQSKMISISTSERRA